MYEDAWYSFVPEAAGKNAANPSGAHGHKRKESLLQQPNVCHPPRCGVYEQSLTRF